ncbi:hypothetical protein NM688_g6412 [Phlebia brevispora]|uniref:Uncharacterized protein n=1 Tax=Phlebia brevispora TaxID=194682 RepID=A0ACC1SG97_9APHY|nr:hypothetical protein NM688_g6412 [Phlebia brevispora]
MAQWGRVGVQIHEIATTFYEKSRKSPVGDGSHLGFVTTVLKQVPNALQPSPPYESFGYLVYEQNGASVLRRASEIMPGDVIVLQDAKLKGHKGLQIYHQNVGAGQAICAIVADYEVKKAKVKVFQANQHVGQESVETASYRLDDLKSGSIKVFRILEAQCVESSSGHRGLNRKVGAMLRRGVRLRDPSLGPCACFMDADDGVFLSSASSSTPYWIFVALSLPPMHYGLPHADLALPTTRKPAVTTMSLLKIPLILVNAVCTYICLTPPNPPAKAEEKSKFSTDTATTDVIPMPLITKTSKILTQSMNAIEITALLVQAYPNAEAAWLLSPLVLPAERLSSSSISITTTFILSVTLMSVAAILRTTCYRHLGRHFTFELSIHEEHKLITDGPYAVVRHPSYTALFIYFAGLVLSMLGDGSWWAEYGILLGFGRILGMMQVGILIGLGYQSWEPTHEDASRADTLKTGATERRWMDMWRLARLTAARCIVSIEINDSYRYASPSSCHQSSGVPLIDSGMIATKWHIAITTTELDRQYLTPPALPTMLKRLVLILNSIATYAVVTPPNPPPEASERAKFGKEKGGRMFVLLGDVAKIVFCSLNFFEALLISLASADEISWLPARLGAFVEVAREKGVNPGITAIFLLGSALICGAGLLRVTCYRYLGRQFTFELALRKGHKLVTGGPYAFVRHPAYTGSLMFVAGAVLVFLVDEGCLTPTEDNIMRKEFGEEWVQWARRTPYKMIPYIF